MDVEMLASLVSKWGTPGLVVGVVLYVVVPLVARVVKARVGGGTAPAAPVSVPGLPATPTAPARFPLLNAVLKAMFPAAAALTADNAHPELMRKLQTELADWHQANGPK